MCSTRRSTASVRTSPALTIATIPGSILRCAAASKRFLAWTDCVAGSSAPYGLMCFATPKPNAPAIAAASTATSSTRRPLASMNVARLVRTGLLPFALGCELTFGRLAPFDDRLGEADPHLQGQVGPGRSLARVRLDRAQVGEVAFFACAYRADDLDPPLGQAVREEQLQHPLVAKLVRRLPFAPQPVPERRFAGRGQLVDGAGAPARRLRSAADEALVLEALEFGIDLAVARGPEVARRPIDERLDVVTGAPTERDHPEDDAARGGQFDLWRFGIRSGHISGRYITMRYECQGPSRTSMRRVATRLWTPARTPPAITAECDPVTDYGKP